MIYITESMFSDQYINVIHNETLRRSRSSGNVSPPCTPSIQEPGNDVNGRWKNLYRHINVEL